MATLQQAAEQVYQCRNHGEHTHIETRWSLAVTGLNGQYEPAEEYEVVICNECNCEVKPEIDWSDVMDDLPY